MEKLLLVKFVLPEVQKQKEIEIGVQKEIKPFLSLPSSRFKSPNAMSFYPKLYPSCQGIFLFLSLGLSLSGISISFYLQSIPRSGNICIFLSPRLFLQPVKFISFYHCKKKICITLYSLLDLCFKLVNFHTPNIYLAILKIHYFVHNQYSKFIANSNPKHARVDILPSSQSTDLRQNMRQKEIGINLD